jgi:flagellin
VGSGYTVATSAGTGGAVGSITIASSSFALASLSTFTVTVNGVTATVALAAGTYTMATFASDVNAALTTAGIASSAASLTYGATGGFTFASTDPTLSGGLVVGGANAGSFGLTTGTYDIAATVSVNGGASVALTAAQNTANTVVDVGVNGATLALTLSGPVAAGSFSATADYSGGANLNTVNFSITSSTAISTITKAIQTVSSMGGTLGAAQNELTDISDNESVMIQNLQSSNAQIQDTDMASQMVNFTQDQTLVQAGVSMLAQANQIPQYVLKLLS